MGSKDQLRIIGPEKTTPYSLYQNSLLCKFLDSNSRKDGRSPVDLRKMFLGVGVLSQAKGSSYVEVGNTKVICGVYGPREIQHTTDFKITGQVFCDITFCPFSSKRRKPHIGDRRQKEMSRQVKEALESVIVLEKFPKAQIDVYVSVIEDGGSLLSTCITASGIALCHGNIDVYDIVVGSSVQWYKGTQYVDPSIEEEDFYEQSKLSVENANDCQGHLTVGMMPTYASGQVCLTIQEGDLSVDELCEGLDLASESCQRIYSLARQVLVSHVEVELSKSKPQDVPAET